MKTLLRTLALLLFCAPAFAQVNFVAVLNGVANSYPLTFTPAQASNTTVNSLILADTTAASSGNQQFSPSIRLTGQGWETGTTASQPVDWIIENDPVQGASSPSTSLIFNAQINGGGYHNYMTLGTTGLTIGYTAGNTSVTVQNGTGTFLVGGGGTDQFGGVVLVNNAAPEFRQYNNVGATDGKYWRNYISGAVDNYGIFNDSGASPKLYFAITRSGDTITDISYGNATDNNTQTFLGTGAATFGGGIAGVTTNSNAAAGLVGEYWDANCTVVTSGASIAFTSATPTVGTYSSPPWAASTAPYGSYACPFYISATAPTGLSTNTTYWAVPINATTFHVSTTAANAMAGTFAATSASSSATVVVSSTYQTATTTVIAVGSMNLTAGDWRCQMSAQFLPQATTSVTNLQAGISASSTAVGALGSYSDFETAANIMTATNNPINISPQLRVSLASTTAEYAVAEATFTASTMNEAGDFNCTRTR